MTTPRSFEGWTSVYSCSTDYEADLLRDRLDASGVDAVVLTQRDHTFNLTVGDMSNVHVMVQPDDVEAARAVIAEAPLSDEELETAAMAADANAEDAHDSEAESRLDSGADKFGFDVPSEKPE